MKHKAGFSLIEIVITIGIVGIVGVGTAASFSHAARFNEVIHRDLLDQQKVQNATEYVLTCGWSKEWNETDNRPDNCLKEVTIEATKDNPSDPYWKIKISSSSGKIDVSTYVRDVTLADPAPEGGDIT